MRYTKWFASIALAAGMAVAGTTAASAQDWRGVSHSYNRADSLRSVIARDHDRLADAYRHGNRREIARVRADLDRHEAELRAELRDNRYDRYGNGYNNRSNGGFNNGFNNGRR
jgi:uncharacterized protein RhaS with RHS repeats